MDEVRGRAADGGDAEVLHDHDLAFSIAAGDGDHGGAEGFRAVVRAQAAGEQAVPERVLDDIARVHATGGEGALHDVGPDIEVVLVVCDDDRLAGCTAAGVEPYDLIHRAGEEAEGIGVSQVGLHHERELGDVADVLDAIRRQAAFLQAAPKQVLMLVRPADDCLQALEL